MPSVLSGQPAYIMNFCRRQVVAAVEGCRERYMRMDLDYDQARRILICDIYLCLFSPCACSNGARPHVVIVAATFVRVPIPWTSAQSKLSS